MYVFFSKIWFQFSFCTHTLFIACIETDRTWERTGKDEWTMEIYCFITKLTQPFSWRVHVLLLMEIGLHKLFWSRFLFFGLLPGKTMCDESWICIVTVLSFINYYFYMADVFLFYLHLQVDENCFLELF